MDTKDIFYPGFDHPAKHLSAFSLCIDVFIISLKNGDIVKFQPKKTAHFKEWLYSCKVRDVAFDDGLPPDYKKPNSSKSSLGFFNLIKINKRNERRKNN